MARNDEGRNWCFSPKKAVIRLWEELCIDKVHGFRVYYGSERRNDGVDNEGYRRCFV